VGLLIFFAALRAQAADVHCTALRSCVEITHWGQFSKLEVSAEPRPGERFNMTVLQWPKEVLFSVDPVGRFPRTDLWFSEDGAMAWRSPGVARTAACAWHGIGMAMLTTMIYPGLYALERAFPGGRDDVGERSQKEVSGDSDVDMKIEGLRIPGPWSMHVLAQTDAAGNIEFDVAVQYSSGRQTQRLHGRWIGTPSPALPGNEPLDDWDVCVGENAPAAAKRDVLPETGGRTTAFSTFAALRSAIGAK
jgi:hypothetical protein